MPAPEIVSSYAQGRAGQPTLGKFGGGYDASLVLDDGTARTANVTLTAINVEGGSLSEVVFGCGAISGTTPTDTVSVEVSVDGGSTYFEILRTTVLDGADLNAPFARLAWIPVPNSGQTLTKVRAKHAIGGTTPSFSITIFLRNLGYGKDGLLDVLT